MFLHCPNCGKEILDENAVFCPYCGKPLAVPAHQAKAIRSTSLPTAAGVVIIMAATISALYGLLGTLNIVLELGRIGSNINLSFEILFEGFFGVLAFAFGLTGAIFAFGRRHFALSMFGTGLVLFYGLGMMASVWIYRYGLLSIFVIIVVLPMIFLSLLGVVFLAVSRREFV